MSKANSTEGQQQVQAVSVSQAAGAALQHVAEQQGVVTAFYPVSLCYSEFRCTDALKAYRLASRASCKRHK
jgi:hypothetical protein